MRKFYCAFPLALACLIFQFTGTAEAQLQGFEKIDKTGRGEISLVLQCAFNPNLLARALVYIAGRSHIGIAGPGGGIVLDHVPEGQYDVTVEIDAQTETTPSIPVQKNMRTNFIHALSFCADDDGDGFTEVEGDCDDNNMNINPNAPEICDGVDNNCDGQIDEGIDLNTDPNNCGTCGQACVDQGPASCGQNGTCVGGSCALYPLGTVCGVGSTCIPELVCDGDGGCTQGPFAPGGTPCDDGASGGQTNDGNLCNSSCNSNGQCVASNADEGAACGPSGESCQSGFCVAP